MVKNIKKVCHTEAGEQWIWKLKPLIIVFGFISGIHYCLIGLIRKRHDCITNSTRGCQDGFISIPVPFLEKHLVISVWWNYCAQPFIDLRCKTSRLPICNNKLPSAAQPLSTAQDHNAKVTSACFQLSSVKQNQNRRQEMHSVGPWFPCFEYVFPVTTALFKKNRNSSSFSFKLHNNTVHFYSGRGDNKTRHGSQ